MKAETTFSLNDQLFNAEKVEWLALRFVGAYPDFPKPEFCKAVVSEFPTLELKQRLAHITECLAVSLPDDFQEAVAIILKALPDPLDPKKRDDDFGDFIIAPLSHFVATRGCNAEQLEVSLAALYEMTQRFSAEDSIRFLSMRSLSLRCHFWQNVPGMKIIMCDVWRAKGRGRSCHGARK